MRPIKFRGRAIETGRDVKIGEYVFGDLRIVGIRPHIYKEAHCYYEEELIEVEPDTVTQLVGYDANGKEVYEGDILIDKNGYEFVATIQSVGCCKFVTSIPVESRPVDFDLIQRFTPLTLKEDNQ